jgi:hypothetical protein
LWFIHPDAFAPAMPQTAAAVAATVWRLVQPVGVQLSVVAHPLRNTPRTIKLSNFCLFTNFSSLQLIPTFLQLGRYMVPKIFNILSSPILLWYRAMRLHGGFTINSLKC